MGIDDVASGPIVSGLVADPGIVVRDDPPPPPQPRPQGPVRVGGVIKPPTRVVYVPPLYPAIARAANVSGVVILEATIGEDGNVRDVRPIRSIPLLDQAAVDAVRQWRFTPTLLNNQPVAVLMTVTVAFNLQ
jgi:protein TonB